MSVNGINFGINDGIHNELRDEIIKFYLDKNQN